ncbi:MAG TPA: porin [Planctomycetaceae bacterium]|nr:porin [Planctomycetaceae bacterium]
MRTFLRRSLQAPSAAIGFRWGTVAAVALALLPCNSATAQQVSEVSPFQDPPAAVSLQQAPATEPAVPTHAVSTQAVSTQALADSPNLEQRVRELEAALHQMQTQQDPHAVAPASANLQAPGPVGSLATDPVPPGPPPAYNPLGPEGTTNQLFPTKEISSGPFAGWRTNGLFIESADKDFSFKITGQIQADYREFLRTKDRTDIDTFLIRRARFGLEATLLKYFDFRLLPDFGNGTTTEQDAYMNVHYWSEAQFEVGRFKQPISYEQLIQDRYVPTLERSIIDQLVPARDIGAMVHGEDLFNGKFDYAASISNGEINGNFTDSNNHKDVDGRVALRPFNDPDNWEAIRYIGVGVSGGFGIEQEAMNPNILRMPDTVPFLVFNATARADGLRTRLCPEFDYFWGPFGFLTEYYEQHQDIRASATGAGAHFLEDVPFRGYMFLSTLFLTGEKRTTYSQQIFPVHNFDPCHPISCPGAWELVGRFSHLDVGDNVYLPGAAALANPNTTANVASEYTLGLNWYLNGYFRMQFNYEHDMFNRSVLLGTSVANNELRSQDTLFTRFQIIF